jgi:hypothetical protein
MQYGGLIEYGPQPHSVVFVARMSHNSSPSSIVVHNHQSQCCVQAYGSYAGFHFGEILGLRPALRFFFAAQACENVESQTC